MADIESARECKEKRMERKRRKENFGPRSRGSENAPWSKSRETNGESAIARPLRVCSSERRVEGGKERKWATVARHANEKKGKNLGHGCLLFSEAGAWVFIRWTDAIRNKYATRESERSRDRRKKESRKTRPCRRQTREAMFDIQICM